MTTKDDEDKLLRSVALQNASSILIARQRAEQRSEAYLAEAQRLSHTGSFGWRTGTGEIIWSEETFRIFQYDRTMKPSVELVLQRVHPEDATLVKQTIERASQDGKDFDFDHRLLMPDGSVKYVHVVAHALNDESGSVEFVGAVMDVTERKRAEEALRRSEAYLAEAQGLSHTGSWHWNAGTGEVVCSQEVFAIFGLDSENTKASYPLLMGRVHPEDRSNLEEVLRAAVREKRDWEAEHRLLLPGGLIKYLHSIARCLVSQSGDIEYIGAVLDITQSKNEESARRYSEERYRAVVETAHDAVISIDESGAVLLANPATAKVFGYEPAELIGKPLTILMPEFMRKRHEAGFSRYLATGRRHISWQGTEMIGVRKNGQEFPVELSFGELTRDGHRVFTGFIRDISEKKKAEDALRRSEAYLAEAQRLAHIAAWVWQVPERNTPYLSDEWYRIYGFDPQGGLPPWEERLHRVHPEDRATWKSALDWAIAEESDYDVGFRILLPGTGVKYIRTVGHPVFDAAAHLVQFVCVSMDVTERKRAEEERERLRQAQVDLAHINRVSTMGELTASLAHEIKQPISAAATDAETCLQWLGRDQPDLAEAQAAASRLIKDVTRASDIISRIGSLFKKDVPQRELVQIDQLIDEMVSLIRIEAVRYSISIHSDLAKGLPKIMADRVGLQQVFMNLMLNGIDAMKDMGTPGRLTITVRQSEDHQLIVSVSDTGVGLRPEQKDKIFNAFFTSKPQGTGMGLPISRSIIESHGGRLWATSGDGPGATFQFTLPIEHAENQVI